MVMSAASRIPSIGLLRRSKPIFNPSATKSSTTSSVSVREPIHTTPPTSQPAARSGSPASMPPHTGGVSEDTFQAASRGVQQRFMQFMSTPRLQ
ncbi:proline-rich receptor-like protein kinase PERK9 [Sesbania bispinosa]|nr:proline-rich receptor-like protein kinase PERK9 [Sesbania bispinosa]